MNEKCVTYHSSSDQETIQLGRKLGELLVQNDIVALAGDLGSGKTWFAKGIARGLGVSLDIVITSPSFALVNEYEGRYPFFHIDAYRLENRSEFLAAGLDEYFYQNGVVAMEWADRWPEILPDWTLNVEFAIQSERSRKITFSGHHPRTFEILESMTEN